MSEKMTKDQAETLKEALKKNAEERKNLEERLKKVSPPDTGKEKSAHEPDLKRLYPTLKN